jgi:hypothetical protein
VTIKKKNVKWEMNRTGEIESLDPRAFTGDCVQISNFPTHMGKPAFGYDWSPSQSQMFIWLSPTGL